MQFSMPKIQTFVQHRLAIHAALLFIGVLNLSGWQAGASDVATRGKEVFQTCVPCHNADGSGNPVVGSPNIAGMKQWYVQVQLQKFRSGARGMQFNDVEGMRMRPMALSLSSDADVEAVARYVETLPPVTHPPTLKGDAHAGDNQFHLICAACHGENGQGNQDLKAPRLAGIDDWYLATQLRKFRSGVRGTNPKDTEGRMMRPMARGLADDEAVRNVVSYIDSLKP